MTTSTKNILRVRGGLFVVVGVATSIGLSAAALYFAGLRAASRPVHQVLFSLKLWFSAPLGRWFGWDEHKIYHEPIGLWLTFLAITVVVGAIAYLGLTSRTLGRRSPYPATIGAFAPWCVLVMVAAEPFGESLAVRILVVVTMFGAMALVARRLVPILLLSRSVVPVTAAALIGLVLYVGLVDRYVDYYAAPLAFTTAVVSCVLIALWIRRAAAHDVA